MRFGDYILPIEAESIDEYSEFLAHQDEVLKNKIWTTALELWIETAKASFDPEGEFTLAEWIDIYLQLLDPTDSDTFERHLIAVAEEISPKCYVRYLHQFNPDALDHYEYEQEYEYKMEQLEAPEYFEYRASELTELALRDGRRIAKSAGICYVCGALVGNGRGELMLNEEIPDSVSFSRCSNPPWSRSREGKKWYVRCLTSPCSSESFGKRKPLKHPKSHTNRPNQRADRCIICQVPISAENGFLVERKWIPRWLWEKPAFPRAKEKMLYVVCGELGEVTASERFQNSQSEEQL